MLRIRLKCPKHPRYDPAHGGQNAIVGGCQWCLELLVLYKQTLMYERALYIANHTEGPEEIT